MGRKSVENTRSYRSGEGGVMSRQRSLKKSLATYDQHQQVKERDAKGRKVCRWGDFKIMVVETIKKKEKQNERL